MSLNPSDYPRQPEASTTQGNGTPVTNSQPQQQPVVQQHQVVQGQVVMPQQQVGQGQVVMPQQQAVQGQVVAPQSQPQGANANQIKPRKKYKNILYGFGIVEVVMGIISCILCVVTLIVAANNDSYIKLDTYNGHYYQNRITYGSNIVSQGIWCGAVLIVCGVLGINTKKHCSVCMYRANMAMSIVASFFMMCLCILSAVSCVTVYPLEYNYIVLPYHIVLAIIGFVGMLLCIVHSAFCCAGICCRSSKYRQGAVLYSGQAANQQGQWVQLANGQYMLIPAGQYHIATSTNTGSTQPASTQAVFPAEQAPQTSTAVYPTLPDQQTGKEQEALINSEPPAYPAQSAYNPAT